MKIARTLEEFTRERKAIRRDVAFVPTMGALHQGHLSLMEVAQRGGGSVIASIFVNPTQFAVGEDYDTYPRSEQTDLAMLASAGVELVLLPREDDIYPQGVQACIATGNAAIGLESDSRPAFFAGVVTVVHRLFSIVRPQVAVFGEKDFQQLQVIQEMVQAQGMPIEVIGAPTQRDEHGLALSSRNVYLDDEELSIARKLNRLLFDIADRLSGRDHEMALRHPNGMTANASNAGPAPNREAVLPDRLPDTFLQAGFDAVDYVALKPEWNRLLAAVRVGNTRLIDNCAIR